MTERKSVFRHWHYQARETVFTDSPELRDGEQVFCVRNLTRAEAGEIAGETGTLYLDGHYPVIRSARGYVTEAASWFGAANVAEAGAEHCARVWAWLSAAVRHYWHDERVTLLATPASTGRDLWLRTIPPNHAGYPVLSDDLQGLIRSTAHQGRIEVMPAPPGGATVGGLWEYDLRFAYLAVARNLPLGRPELRQAPTITALTVREPARWSVRFTVPKRWNRPGLLPVMAEGGGWHYPTVGRHTATVDGCELALAVQHGWKIEPLQALVWPDTGNPFRVMSDRLQRILTDSLRHSELTRRMVRQAVRAVALHTIGSMHGAGHKVSRTGEPDQVPAEAERLQVLPDGRMSWVEMEPAPWAETVHPEWSAHIWARARYRVAAAMMQAPAGTVVAVRTDAIYSTEPWNWLPADDGKIGRWVLKRTVPGPLPWPASHSELLRMREAANNA